MITFASLRGVRPSGLASAAHEYGRSATVLGKDADRYRDHVVRPIRSGHVWHGDGQGDATVVTRVLALAFDTAAVRMHTVTSLLTTLHSELTAAKADVNSVVGDATAAGYDVDQYGTITDPTDSGGMFVCPSTGGIDVGQAHSYENIARLEARLRIAVARARRADTSCSSGLAEVIGADFVVATTAQPGLLKQAENANVAAYGDYARALLLPQVLATAHRADVAADKLTEHGTTDFWRDYAKGVWASTFGAVPDLVRLLWLLDRAGWGDRAAWGALATVPPALWRQISTAAGWQAMFAVDDLEAGRPGAFAGKNTLLIRELLRTIAKKAAEHAVRKAVEDEAASAGRLTAEQVDLRSAEIAQQASREAKGFTGRRVDYDLGSAGTREDAMALGKKFVGPGYQVRGDGHVLMSADGTRIFRMPELKHRGVATGHVQANFEIRDPEGGTNEKILSNGHLWIENP